MLPAGSRQNHPAAFTLIELLVVLVVIGIILGAIGFSMGSRERQQLAEAERLLALLRMAQQETLLTAGDAAVAFHPKGYCFLRREEDRWLPVREGIYRPRFLDEDIELSLRFLEDASGAVQLPPLDREILGAGIPEFEAAIHDLPRIYFFSGGEITPFELTISLADKPDPLVIGGTIQGQLRLLED